MQPDTPPVPITPLNLPTTDKGLPPVAAPSGRHIAQMFVVPGLIVVVIVILYLCSQWFVAGESNPSNMVDGLESNDSDHL
jgi:hypothetical protein